MNRLWVRLSLTMLSAYLVFVIPFLLLPSVINLYLVVQEKRATMTSEVTVEGSVASEEQGMMSDWITTRILELGTELYRIVIFGSIIGSIGGLWASWRLSKPISRLAEAANAIRQRDFSHRVKPERWATELQTLADTFNGMATDLDQSERLRRQLITDVAHELRTPLTVLAGNLNAALDRVYNLSEEEFANLYSQTNHLIRLVNDLHELSQAEARQLPLDRKPVDMLELCRQVAELFKVIAEERGITIVCHLPSHEIRLTVDEVRIRQVLHNLISNAVEHSPTGGTITLRIEEMTDCVTISVQDTGMGIEPQHLPQVFERFYRSDASRSRETGGSGLGLTIVKAIVELHDGRVSAHSAGKNRGSTFTIELSNSS